MMLLFYVLNATLNRILVLLLVNYSLSYFGYPLLKDVVKCSKCDQKANRVDWNKYVGIEKACPMCSKPELI
jgi:hypothetical protein